MTAARRPLVLGWSRIEDSAKWVCAGHCSGCRNACSAVPEFRRLWKTPEGDVAEVRYCRRCATINGLPTGVR